MNYAFVRARNGKKARWKREMTPPSDISVLFHPRDSSYKFSRERNCFFVYTVEKLSRNKGGKYFEVNYFDFITIRIVKIGKQ